MCNFPSTQTFLSVLNLCCHSQDNFMLMEAALMSLCFSRTVRCLLLEPTIARLRSASAPFTNTEPYSNTLYVGDCYLSVQRASCKSNTFAASPWVPSLTCAQCLPSIHILFPLSLPGHQCHIIHTLNRVHGLKSGRVLKEFRLPRPHLLC